MNKVLYCLIIALIMSGCSTVNNAIDKNAIQTRLTPDYKYATESHGLLGIYSVHADLTDGISGMSLMRNSLLTDVLETVDITNFMTVSPCFDCAKIRSIGLDPDSNIFLTIGIRHPFPPGDPYKPITGRNRADLHVFNVEGIVISSLTGTVFSATGETVSGVNMVNPDGYTKYLDSALDEIYPTDATIHPYITHFDDYSVGSFNPTYPMGFLSVVDPPPMGNLVMPMGSDYDYKDYVFKAESGMIDFIFAVGCTYPIAAASFSDRFQPEYRIPQHNKKAASEVSIEIIENNLIELDTLSTAQIEVHVIDISHGVEVGNELDKMLADSSVETISIEIPGVMLEPIEINGADSVSGSGHNPSDPLVYQATITNTTGIGVGTYPGLVKVLDSYPPGLNAVPSLQEKDGIKRVEPLINPITGLISIDEFATYQTFSIDVDPYIEIPIWPVHQGNRSHTGMVGLNGPFQNHDNYTWQGIYPPTWNYYGNPLPVFLSDDTIFLSNTGDGGPLPCLAIDMATHELKWSQQFHSDMQNWLNLKCINEDGTVVLTHETKYNRLVGLDAEDGSFKWEVTGAIKVDSYPTLDLDGNFIVPLEDVGIISIRPSDGIVNWTANIGDTYYSVPAVGENGVIYCTHGGQWSGDVVAVDSSDGHLIWTSPGIGALRGNATVVHPNQTIIAHGNDGLFCFRDLGTSCEIAWQQPYACPFYASVGIGPTGDIFLLDWDGTLRRINPDTGETTQSQTGWGDTGLSGNFVRMAIGADGLMYFGYYEYNANKAWFACANPDCTLKWRHYGGQWFMGDGLYAAPAIGQDGTVYSSYRPDGLVAWRD